MQVRTRPIGGWGLIIKQLIDYTFAGIGLLVSAPLFLAIAVAIKLEILWARVLPAASTWLQ